MTPEGSAGPGMIACPQCGSEIPKDPRWVTWCEACDWNLEAGAKKAPAKSAAASAARRADRSGRRLFEEMRDPSRDHGRRGSARSATIALAILLHLPAPLLVIAALGLVSRFGLDVVNGIGALALLGLAVVLRPRLGTLPRHWPVLSRDGAPELFRLADQIASSLGAKGPEWVAFRLDYNAETAMVGLRRRRLIVIGFPLWIALTPEERVAVLAHEIAHDINGDLAHSLVVGSALQLLASLDRLLSPPRSFHRRRSSSIIDTLTALSEWLAKLFMLGLRSGVDALFRLLLRSARRASPRAEYLADEAAARVASPAALATCLDKLLLARTAVQFLSMAGGQGAEERWPRLEVDIKSISAKEHERLRRLARREGHRVDATHPPTANRIGLIQGLPQEGPMVTLDGTRTRAIEQELGPVKRQLAEMLG